MKNPIILSLVVLSVLLVGGIGCTVVQPTGADEDERYDRRMSSANDPYYYSSRPVLVQDARTGRYFYVYPNDLYSSFDPYRFDSRYSNGYNRYYNDYYYAPSNRGTSSRPQLTEEQRKVQKEKLEESRKRILGKND